MGAGQGSCGRVAGRWIVVIVVIVTSAGLAQSHAAQAADPTNGHADRAAAIDSKNVGSLRQAWKVATPAPVTHRPLVEGGRVFFADWSGTVRCVEEASGMAVWEKAVEQPKTDWPWHGFSGTGALGDGLVFEASSEGNLFALDTRTGETRWKARFAPEGEAYTGNCGAILHHDGLVYVGTSSVEEGIDLQVEDFTPSFRGRVLAFDAKSGAKAWELALVEAPGTGVAVWSGFALDPRTKTLFFTTGNNYVGRATAHSDALVAADAKTGRIRWSKQLTAFDVWTMKETLGPDYDFATGPQLFEAQRDGRALELVGAGQKSGLYCALARDTGELVWQTVVGYGQIGGGIMADASVADGRVFVWSNNGYVPSESPAAESPMTVKALDAATGAPLWTVPKAQPAGVTSAGWLSRDVYLVASLDGRVRAYHGSDGKLLWTSPEDPDPIGSSLTVSGSNLLFGRGVPQMFGGKDGGSPGLVCFTAGTPPPLTGR